MNSCPPTITARAKNFQLPDHPKNVGLPQKAALASHLCMLLTSLRRPLRSLSLVCRLVLSAPAVVRTCRRAAVPRTQKRVGTTTASRLQRPGARLERRHVAATANLRHPRPSRRVASGDGRAATVDAHPLLHVVDGEHSPAQLLLGRRLRQLRLTRRRSAPRRTPLALMLRHRRQAARAHWGQHLGGRRQPRLDATAAGDAMLHHGASTPVHGRSRVRPHHAAIGVRAAIRHPIAAARSGGSGAARMCDVATRRVAREARDNVLDEAVRTPRHALRCGEDVLEGGDARAVEQQALTASGRLVALLLCVERGVAALRLSRQRDRLERGEATRRA